MHIYVYYLVLYRFPICSGNSSVETNLNEKNLCIQFFCIIELQQDKN